jgi:hypothetical protein
VLKALGSLPDPPSRQQLHRDEARKAHHSSRYDPDEEDSDSDGPSASTSRRKQHQPSLFLDDRPARRAPRRRSPSAGASSSGFPSDDSDPSSEESDDGASDGGAAYYSSRRSARRALEDDMEESGLSKPLARKFLRNLQRAAGSRSFSVLGLYKDRDVRNTRNRHEMEFLARVIDLMRKGRSAHVMEALVRRLVGVETADRSGNWKLCDAFELITEKQSFVPDDFLARALKTVKRIEAVEGKDRQRDRHRDAASSNTRGNAYGRSSSGYGSNARGRDRYPSEPSAYNGRERSSSRGPAASSSSSAQQQPHSKQQQQGGKQQQRGPRKGE